MEELLQFVDDFTFETQLYFRVGSLYEGPTFELQWQSSEQKPWRMKEVGAPEWRSFKTNEFLQALNQDKVNLMDFEIKLRSNLLQQVAYAESYIRRAEKLFGRETIQEAIITNKEFLRELEKAVHSLLGEKKAPSPPTAPLTTVSSEPGLDRGRAAPNTRKLRPEKQGPKGFLRLLCEGSKYSVEPRS